MRKFTCLALLLAAASPALISTARAQLETFNTIQDYGNYSLYTADANQGFTTGTALSQTFTNVREITDMTYRFVSLGGSTTSASMTAYFVEWTNSGSPTGYNGYAASATPIYSTTFTIPATGSSNTNWSSYEFADNSGSYRGYDYTLDINQLLDPAKTYAVVLVSGNSGANVGLMNLENYGGVNDASDGFNYGNNYRRGGVTDLSSMDTSGSQSTFAGGDWGFEQLDIVPASGTPVPLPEPRTAAAIISALFVAVLIGRQLLLRRKDQPISGALA